MLPDLASQGCQARLSRVPQLIIELRKLFGRGDTHAHRALVQCLTGERHFLAENAGELIDTGRGDVRSGLGGLLRCRQVQALDFVQIMVEFDFHGRARTGSLCPYVASPCHTVPSKSPVAFFLKKTRAT